MGKIKIPNRISWLLKYWFWNPTTLPMWALAVTTMAYVILTYGLWSGQREANRLSQQQFKEAQDSTYRHFREALDSERSRSEASLHAQMLQLESSARQFAAVNDVRLVILNPLIVDTSFSFDIRNAGKSAALIYRVDFRLSGDPQGQKDTLKGVDSKIATLPGDSPAVLRCGFILDPNFHPHSVAWHITLDIYFRDALGNAQCYEGVYVYNRQSKVFSMIKGSTKTEIRSIEQGGNK